MRNVENSGHWKGNIKLRIQKSLMKIMNCDKLMWELFKVQNISPKISESTFQNENQNCSND